MRLHVRLNENLRCFDIDREKLLKEKNKKVYVLYHESIFDGLTLSLVKTEFGTQFLNEKMYDVLELTHRETYLRKNKVK